MARTPNNGNESESNSPQQSELETNRTPRGQRRRLFIWLGVVLLVGVGGGLTYAWIFIQRQLAPLVAQNLTLAINRPINVGKVESFSLTGIRFGASEIPATVSDTDRASVEAVKVAFDPVQLIFNRTLRMSATLINPDVYIEQDLDGVWVATKFEEELPLKIDLQTIRIKNANVTVVPRFEGQLLEPLTIALDSGKTNFLNNYKLIQFDTKGYLAQGKLNLSGDIRPKTGVKKLAISAEKIDVTEINDSFLREFFKGKTLPFNIKSGQVNAKIDAEIKGKQITSVTGTASIENLTTKIARQPNLPVAKTNGKLRFQGTEVELENFVTLIGEIQVNTEGVIGIESGFNLTAKTGAVEAQKLWQTANFQELPVPVSGAIETTLQVTGNLPQPKISALVATTKVTQIDKVKFSTIKAKAALAGSNLVIEDFQAIPTVGGQIKGNGRVILGKDPSLVFNFGANNLPSGAIASLYGTNLPIPVSAISGQARIFGPLGKLEELNATGFAGLNLGGGKVTSNIQLVKGSWQGEVQASGVQLSRLPQIPVQLKGEVNGNLKISGSLENLSVSVIKGNGAASLYLPKGDGKVTVTNVQLANNRWQAKIQTQGLQLANLSPQIPAALGSSLTGNFDLKGSLTSFSPESIEGSGGGSLNLAGGNINATAKLNKGNWQAKVIATGLETRRFASFLPTAVQKFAPLLGQANGTFNLAGNLNNLTAQGIRLTGDGGIGVAGGTVTATNVQLANGNFQVVVAPSNIQLSSFSDQLRGNLEGSLNFNGNLANLNPAGIKAVGEVNFSEGVALIEGPLTTKISWNGNRLDIQEAQAPGLNARGFVDTNLAKSGLDIVQRFNLNVQAEGLNLAKLPSTLPDVAADVTVAGSVDFDGTIAGTPTAPNVSASLALRNLALPAHVSFAFDPLLEGTVNSTPGKGLNLQLAGKEDQIQLALGADYLPESFLVRLDEFVARGDRQGDLLLVSTENLPLAPIKEVALFALERLPNVSLDIPVAIATQTISGKLSSDLRINLRTFGVSGEVAIASPVIGELQGDEFTGSFQYTDGVAAINEAKFQKGDSQYTLLDASFTPTPKGPEFQAKVQVDRGKIQQILSAAGIFEFEDLHRYTSPSSVTYGSAADLGEISRGFPSKAPIIQQLRLLSGVEAWLQRQKEQKEASPIPELAKLEGNFSGSLTVSGSPASGIDAKFNFQGEEWEWGHYNAEEVIAQGSFQNGLLTILPVHLQLAQDSSISFSGSLGAETQSGQLKVVNLPIALIQKVVELPPAIRLSGSINATAALAGSKENPQARGEVSVIDATINQKPIQSAQGSFSYNNSRLEFSARSILTADSNPLKVTGSIPYKLPITSVEPDSDKLSVSVNVKDKGLSLLNLFTKGQVVWIDGKGEVKLDISGTFNQEKGRPEELIAQGVVDLEKATVSAQALPDQPITDINGKILFNFDWIEVESLRGNLSTGEISVAGNLPIFQPTSQDNPLTVTLHQLALNLKGLYDGGVKGQVKITGSALEPNIGGKILLFDGQVLLPDSAVGTGVKVSSNGTAEEAENIEFNNLMLTLGENVEVAKSPILNFLISGSLNINGTFNNIRPKGTIKLQRGQINLFSTQFLLESDYNNVAVFTPKQGLDPNLDVRLMTSVIETARKPILIDASSAEVSDTTVNFGSSQRIRIQARVFGLASKLNDNLKLTSIPPHSKAEIVSLLGGSLIETVAREGAPLGLAELAGSAVLGSFQDSIGKTFGLSEFRLFPVLITDEQRGSSRLGLGTEAGVNIGDNVSLSAVKIFAGDNPFQYNIRYRLNENTVLRGATDFSGNNRASVEYEIRF
ncbi:MAG: translocation/assembly module TamB domain-containing protein [Xenococcaceae cyanobacterium]